MKKKILSVMLVAAMGLSLFGCGSKSDSGAADESAAASGEKDSYTIAWVDGNLANESNAVCTTAAEEHAKELGIDFKLLDGEGSGENQVAQCETLIEQGVDCIMMQPYDAAACQAGVEKCIEAGVPVLVVKAPIEDNSICPLVAQDDTVAGAMELEWMAEQLGGKGNIVVLEGPTGNSAAINRNDGINEALKKYPDIKVLYTQTANWNREEGMGLMETWLQMGEQIDGVVAHNDEMALGAVDAITDAGKAGEIKVIGIDGIDAALAAVDAGELDATVYQDVLTISEKAVDVALEMAKGNEVEKTYYIDPVMITKDNIGDFLK